MKVCIITLVGYFNYGNRLQNFALQEILKSIGISEVDTIEVLYTNNKIKRLLKLVVTKKDESYKLKKLVDIKKEISLHKFTRKYICNKSIISLDGKISKSINDMYDFFIVGSDQVWNPYYWSNTVNSPELNNYLLEFADNSKKISYAASFGVSDLEKKYLDIFIPKLKYFKNISVRETEGKRIIQPFLEKEVTVLLDPTLMLDCKNWRKISANRLTNNKYILLYYLGNDSSEMKYINRFAMNHNFKIINLLDKKCNYYSSGPEEFLSLIDNAELVITDSFHAVVFSILFHTPFIATQREQCNVKDMSSRIKSLLSIVRLQNRFGDVTQLLEEECDFSKVDAILCKKRLENKEWIKKALQK